MIRRNLRDPSPQSHWVDGMKFKRGRSVVNPPYEWKMYSRHNKSQDLSPIQDFIPFDGSKCKRPVDPSLNGSLALHAQPFLVDMEVIQKVPMETILLYQWIPRFGFGVLGERWRAL
jgi:hypothetical protein